MLYGSYTLDIDSVRDVLNAGTKICASHYTACFVLSADTTDDLATCSCVSTKVLFCSICYVRSLLHTFNTRIYTHVHERAGLGHIQ